MSRLADQIANYIQKNAENEDAITVRAIAEALNEDAVVVAFVLDSYIVGDEGVHYVGTGAGGNWTPVKEETVEDQLNRQLDDGVISQEDYDLRMELVKRGQDPRDAKAMQELLAERGRA